MKEFDKALKHAKLALSFNTRDIHAYTCLGSVYFSKGEIDQALEYFQKTLSINPNDITTLQLKAKALGSKKQFVEATVLYKRILELEENNSEANMGLAAVYINLERDKDAIPLLEKAVKIDPEDLQARQLLANSYVANNRFEESIPELNFILSRSFEPDVALSLVTVYFVLGKTEEGFKLIDSVKSAKYAVTEERVENSKICSELVSLASELHRGGHDVVVVNRLIAKALLFDKNSREAYELREKLRGNPTRS
eukprot:TRINITY_DN11552_c0_g1_i1.p1 TRINITY_DN11552_c0_g1~~TRINITY_DN11552_c0_g1_i1.p1  ORF type:complete len:253 (-),score=24.35 TRINITY_DN11552_c0_g1_i1:30-788(-)